MRAEQWRPKEAPTRDIITIIESAVECSMGGDTAHRVRFAVDGFGNIKEMGAPCPQDDAIIDAVRRLGGKCCSEYLNEFLDFALGRGPTDEYGRPVCSMPQPLDVVLKVVRDHGTEVRNARELGRTDPVHEKMPSTIGALSDTEAARLNAQRMIEDGADRAASRMNSLTGLSGFLLNTQTRLMDDGDREQLCWHLVCWGYSIGTRNWNSRGWHFDENRIRKHIPQMRDAFLVNREATTNNYCIACRKRWTNPRTHIKTQRHADKAMLLFHKAMKAFPGPPRKKA